MRGRSVSMGLFAPAPFSVGSPEIQQDGHAPWRHIDYEASPLPSPLFPCSTLNATQQDQQLAHKGLHGSALGDICSSLLCSYCLPRGTPLSSYLLNPTQNVTCPADQPVSISIYFVLQYEYSQNIWFIPFEHLNNGTPLQVDENQSPYKLYIKYFMFDVNMSLTSNTCRIDEHHTLKGYVVIEVVVGNQSNQCAPRGTHIDLIWFHKHS